MNTYRPGDLFPADQICTPEGGVEYVVTKSIEVDGFDLPRGFKFDGNSAPRFAWWMVARDDCLAASAVHDFIYRGPGQTNLYLAGVAPKSMRFVADLVWAGIMARHGIAPWKITIAYRCLRLFGSPNFIKHYK